MSEQAAAQWTTTQAEVSELHIDNIERLDDVFYIRWTSGPDYERAYICVWDGEPDMNDIACTTFKQARAFEEAYQVALSRAASQNKQG